MVERKMSKAPRRTTYNIDMDKKMKLEMIAIELSYKLGRPIKWTEIMDKLVDDYAKDAAKDIEHDTKENPKKM